MFIVAVVAPALRSVELDGINAIAQRASVENRVALSANNSAMSRSSAEFSAAVCGLIRTLGSVQSGLSGANGSDANTSSAANPTCSSRSASISAGLVDDRAALSTNTSSQSESARDPPKSSPKSSDDWNCAPNRSHPR